MAEQEHRQSGSASVDHVERADPDGSIRSSIEIASVLKDPLARSLLAALGAPADSLDRMLAASDELRSLVTGYQRWAPLSQIGWAITDLATPQVYDQAAELLDAGKQRTAEEVLEDYWNEPGRLESAALRVLRVAIYSETRIQVGQRRHELVELAVADHRAERYHASVPVALAQAEGMVRDVIDSSPFLNPNRLSDDVSSSGHPDILQPIFESSRATMKRTVLDVSGVFPPRHGVLHGRDLGYDNRRNSTKALIALTELATFCQAQLVRAEKDGTLEDLDRQAFGSA
ncbi:MAG: hypothetical protein P1T08_16810 [Acidimicrobiia bacterium]|nr:hypothetical protein [Acidimicrobiia bacterium]